MKNKSIMIITSYNGPYGGNFIASLRSLDNKIKDSGYRTVFVLQKKVQIFSWIGSVRQLSDSIYFLDYKPNFFSNIFMIRKIIKDENVKLIYSRMSGWDIDAHLASRKTPIIWHMEMNPNLSNIIKRLKYFYKYRIIGDKNVYPVAVSEPVAEKLNSLNLKNNCVAIKNAADFSRLSKDLKNISLEKPFKLIIFGYDPYVKGLDIALEACAKLNKSSTNCILMVSSQKNTYNYIREMYGDNKPSWLELLRPTENISALYDKADAILSSSRFEGFSFCLLEALYSGLPAIYSDIDGTNWVDEMKSVYKFKSENADELVKSIKECMLNYISRSDQEFNRSIIEKNYSLDVWSNSFIEYINSILG